MSTNILLEKIYLQKQRRNRSYPIINKWLIDKELEVLRNCPLCEYSYITVISNEDRYGANIRTGICNQCSLIFLIDQPSIKDYSEFYDNVYRPLVSAYLGRDINAVSIKEEQKQYARKIIQSFYGQFTIDDNLSFLDIGGSTGMIGQVFKDEFNINDITILDPIDEELNEARKLGFKSISGLLETWDNPDNLKYDIVFCGRTIDHFKDIKLSLQKLQSLLKSNGVLLIDIIDLSMIWQRREIIESSFKIDHCQYLNNMNAVEILGFCGLEVIFSEIASHPERVTYICKSTNPKSLPSYLPTNAKQMISDIQKSKIIIADMWNSPYTYRQKFYRWRKNIRKRIFKYFS